MVKNGGREFLLGQEAGVEAGCCMFARFLFNDSSKIRTKRSWEKAHVLCIELNGDRIGNGDRLEYGRLDKAHTLCIVYSGTNTPGWRTGSGIVKNESIPCL